MSNKTNNTKVRRSGLKIMARLVVLLGSLAYIMLLAVLNGVLGYFCAMAVSVFGALAVAKAVGATVALSYEWIIALGIACGVLRGALRYLEQYSNHYIAFRLLATLRDKIFGALRILCPAKLESQQKGDIIAMITADIEMLEVFYAHTLSPILIALLTTTGVVLFVGFVSSWYLALVALVAHLVIAVVLPPITSKRLSKAGVQYRSVFARFSAYFLDSIKGIRDITLNNAGDKRSATVDQYSEQLLRHNHTVKQRTTRAYALMEVCVTLFILATVAVGILLVYSNMLSVGYMIVGVTTVVGSFGAVIAISNLPGSLTQTFAAGDRVLNLLSEQPAVRPISDGKDIQYNELIVRDVNFAYDHNAQVLKDISMYAKQGEIVGIVGASGCGKSTLLKLLMRFWQKDSGNILYNDTDIDQVNTDSLLNNVSMVSQSTYLFDETLEYNLRIANPNCTQQEMQKVAQMASVDKFVEALPDGYQTMAGMLGDRLSAGEKQRIGLARAFLRGSSLILLDEPTSNVDSINEGIILQSLVNLKGKKCIILVSHRESTMAIADRVYRVHNGKLEEIKNNAN